MQLKRVATVPEFIWQPIQPTSLNEDAGLDAPWDIPEDQWETSNISESSINFEKVAAGFRDKQSAVLFHAATGRLRLAHALSQTVHVHTFDGTAVLTKSIELAVDVTLVVASKNHERLLVGLANGHVAYISLEDSSEFKLSLIQIVPDGDAPVRLLVETSEFVYALCDGTISKLCHEEIISKWRLTADPSPLAFSVYPSSPPLVIAANPAKPMLSVYSLCDSRLASKPTSPIDTIANKTAAKLSSAAFEIARGFFSKSPIINPALGAAASIPILISNDILSLEDGERTISRLLPSLDDHCPYVLAIDDLNGRIMVLDCRTSLVVRIFKGYRNISASIVRDSGSRDGHVMLVCIPKRKLVEAWPLPFGPRASSIELSELCGSPILIASKHHPLLIWVDGENNLTIDRIVF